MGVCDIYIFLDTLFGHLDEGMILFSLREQPATQCWFRIVLISWNYSDEILRNQGSSKKDQGRCTEDRAPEGGRRKAGTRDTYTTVGGRCYHSHSTDEENED